mgnify:CR=1 FL=1
MELTTKQVADRFRIPLRTLQRWIEGRLVEPKQVAAAGNPFIFDDKNLREVSVIQSLREAGCSMQEVKAAARYLRSIGHNPYSTGQFLVMSRKKGKGRQIIKLVQGESQAFELLREHQGQALLMLALEEEHKEEPAALTAAL